jgi:hypothetical protein
METDMTHLSLPEPIAACFDADKPGGTAVVRCFTDQAVVRDEGQIHTGLAAIAAWKTAASARYVHTIEPLRLERSEGRHVVTSRVSGDFPGSPVELRFVFELERRKIASLEITS